MAITTIAGLQAALPGQQIAFSKSSGGASSLQLSSTWRSGGNPAAGAIPATGSGAVPDNTTTGAIPFVNAVSGNLFIASWVVQSILPSRHRDMLMADRLVHTSGLDGTLTTTQTVNTTAITRGDTNGVGADAFLEWYGITGVTPVTATVAYTDTTNTGQSASVTIPASTQIGTLLPIISATGHLGVKSVQSVTLSASTGTAGNFGVTIMRRLTEVTAFTAGTTANNGPNTWRVTAMAQIPVSACLFIYEMIDSAGGGAGHLSTIQLVNG